MKQHITESDLKELSPKAKEKLREWWKPKTLGEIFFDPKYGYVSWNPSTPMAQRIKEIRPLPLLSLGQMIGFLDEHKVDWSYHNGWLYEDLGHDQDGNEFFEKRYNSLELCDALWEAVKEVLEKNDLLN